MLAVLVLSRLPLKLLPRTKLVEWNPMAMPDWLVELFL